MKSACLVRSDWGTGTNDIWSTLSGRLEVLSELFFSYGINRQPYDDSDRLSFLEQSTLEQTQILQKFERYSRVYLEAAQR